MGAVCSGLLLSDADLLNQPLTVLDKKDKNNCRKKVAED